MDRWISKAISLELRILKESLCCRGNQQVEEDSFASVSPSVVPPSEKQRGRAVRSGSDALGREGRLTPKVLSILNLYPLYYYLFYFFLPEVVDSYRNLLPVFVRFVYSRPFLTACRHPLHRGTAPPSFLYSGVFKKKKLINYRLLDWCSCLRTKDSFSFLVSRFLDNVNSFLPTIIVAGEIFCIL